jgi:hypothetical protein
MPRKTLIQNRRDTAANWDSVNPILASGEFGVETDTNKFKIGDGVTDWQNLAYQGSQGIPAGGTSGQVLTKLSSTNYDIAWADATGASSSATQLKHLVRNTTGATLTKGTVVYTSGANGTNILVAKAQATNDQLSAQTLGFVENNIANNATGYVVNNGIVDGVNTSSADAGDPVWLSPTTLGGVVFGLANKPEAPNHLVYLGVVTKKSTNGEVFVHISNGWELDELHNVNITSPANGDVITYDSTLGYWKNTSGITYLKFTQNSQATTWTINHSLPFFPNVTTTDSNGNVLEGTVEYTSATQVVVTLSEAYSGYAYLS